MLKGIDHVAVAVRSIQDTMGVWCDLLGFDLVEVEEVPDQKVRVAVLRKGSHKVELVEPAAPESPIARFLEKRGPGLHHVCLDVEGLEGMLESIRAAGLRLIDEAPRAGAQGRRIAFVHPSATGGVLCELSEAGSPPAEAGP